MKKGSIYQLEGRVPLGQAVPLGIQHVLAMFLGNVSPLIIVCGLLNIPKFYVYSRYSYINSVISCI